MRVRGSHYEGEGVAIMRVRGSHYEGEGVAIMRVRVWLCCHHITFLIEEMDLQCRVVCTGNFKWVRAHGRVQCMVHKGWT